MISGMTPGIIKELGAELIGMFAGDKRLTVAILAIVAAAGSLVKIPGVEIAGANRLAGGAVLLFGCLGLLVASVRRAARAAAPSGR
jgi:hypothetical protein